MVCPAVIAFPGRGDEPPHAYNSFDHTMIPFWKTQSVGNDFPVVLLDDVESDALPALAIAMADRHFGIGGDGLLALRVIDRQAFDLRMFNPDGTEDFCGNGIRCAAQLAHAEGWTEDEFTVLHGGEAIPIRVRDGRIVTTLGPASYDAERVPYVGSPLIDAGIEPGLVGTALTTGSTHLVIPVDRLPESPEFEVVSARLEVDPRFPNRTSVICVETVGVDALKIRIWERGVGETLGCGTGTSAAAADYLRRQGRGGEVTVQNRGGTLLVSLEAPESRIELTGTAEILFRGQWPSP